MKIEYKKGELSNLPMDEVFNHGCFGNKSIGIEFIVEADEWVDNGDK